MLYRRRCTDEMLDRRDVGQMIILVHLTMTSLSFVLCLSPDVQNVRMRHKMEHPPSLEIFLMQFCIQIIILMLDTEFRWKTLSSFRIYVRRSDGHLSDQTDDRQTIIEKKGAG